MSSILKSTISLVSSTLFPGISAVSKSTNRTINGSQGALLTNTIAESSSEVIFESTDKAGKTGTLYFYINAADTNGALPIDIEIKTKTSNSQAKFIRLYSGDFAYLPIYAADSQGIKITAKNLDPSASAQIVYMFAELG